MFAAGHGWRRPTTPLESLFFQLVPRASSGGPPSREFKFTREQNEEGVRRRPCRTSTIACFFPTCLLNQKTKIAKSDTFGCAPCQRAATYGRAQLSNSSLNHPRRRRSLVHLPPPHLAAVGVEPRRAKVRTPGVGLGPVPLRVPGHDDGVVVEDSGTKQLIPSRSPVLSSPRGYFFCVRNTEPDIVTRSCSGRKGWGTCSCFANFDH